MMIVDIRKLNAQKLYSGNMEFEYNAPNGLIEIPFVNFKNAVKVQFDYELYEDNAFEIHGKVTFQLTGQCSRCLKETDMDVEGELDACFETKQNAEDYSYSNGIVNLEKAVNDAIMACMPYILCCKDGCQPIAYSLETDD